MAKSTTLLALTLVAAATLFTATPVAQAAPTPNPAVQLEKRGPDFAAFVAMVEKARSLTNGIGQGLQAEAPQGEGVVQDVGKAVVQQTNRFGEGPAQDAGEAAKHEADRFAAMLYDFMNGAGWTIIQTPTNLINVVKAIPGVKGDGCSLPVH
ncbi:MAG: hypothetical protein J3R72DRAFT_440785 [Linnemannia gamsii]|nr:MAG: hypothetical protein J3R72DRAFT_440785 [Linnemannia gamsii]